jgi:hypothetical protein
MQCIYAAIQLLDDLLDGSIFDPSLYNPFDVSANNHSKIWINISSLLFMAIRLPLLESALVSSVFFLGFRRFYWMVTEETMSRLKPRTGAPPLKRI